MPSLVLATPITSGQLVNIRVGDGVDLPNGSGSQVRLDVYDVTYSGGAPASVSLSQTIVLPSATNASGMSPPASGNRWLVQGGTAAGEGGLTLSSDGNYMALVGYNTCYAGTTGAGATCQTNGTGGTGNTGQRVVGVLNLGTGTVDTSTDFTVGTSSAIRNAFTTDGTNIWTATSASGVRYTTLGSATSTALTGTGNERREYVYNGQLYTSRMSGTIDGVATVGTGTPSSGTQTVTLLPGLPTSTNSIYDYYFADANTLYMVDDRNSTSGGLEKWTFNGSTWTQVYNLPAAGTTGLKSLAGFTDSAGNVVLFAASVGTNANILYGYGDTLSNTNVANVVANQLVDSSTAFGGATNTWNLRGVAIAPGTVIVPEPSTAVLMPIAAVALLSRRRAKMVPELFS
ncbi:MAG TPA: PEP-CTERM sorting domain-containing protein [Lacipirellulaceae bacterium]|nr:PEP-CTERM sorting domain-containing protein [Lacipirellulaceae bacterium]